LKTQSGFGEWKMQELEPQMDKLQCGEPVEIVADIRPAIREGFLDNWSFHHTFCFLIQ